MFSDIIKKISLYSRYEPASLLLAYLNYSLINLLNNFFFLKNWSYWSKNIKIRTFLILYNDLNFFFIKRPKITEKKIFFVNLLNIIS